MSFGEFGIIQSQNWYRAIMREITAIRSDTSYIKLPIYLVGEEVGSWDDKPGVDVSYTTGRPSLS